MRIPLPQRPVLTLMLFSQGATTDREFWWVVRAKDGRQVVGSRRLTPAAGFSGVVTATVPISEGDLEFASVRSTDDGEQPGTCWCALRLNEAQIPAPGASTPIISGWPSFVDGPTWPTHPTWPPDGRGSPIVEVPLPAPVAGAAATLTLTGVELVELRQARMNIVTDATVANRFSLLRVQTAAANEVVQISPIAQIASTNRQHQFGPRGEAAFEQSTILHINIAPVVGIRSPAMTLGAVSLQAGDVVSLASLFLRWQPVGF